MPQVALVRLRHASQEYWFDPNGVGAQEGDHVLVQTSRGQEIGLCTAGDLEVEEADIKKPLKPVMRIATEEDLEKSDAVAERGMSALRRFRELVEKHELDMKPAAVEFTFDESHAVFYFTAEERVDFRSLVRDLASEFHVHIDMRQVGVRDEARMLGGLGHCGQELCCARMAGDFQPVSIRMAKEQDLPLNPSKISGVCGRLMCCLRYEFEAYKDFKSRAPKRNALIETPQGLAKVVEFDTPRETVRVRFEDGNSAVLPVSALDTGDKVAKAGENIRPCHISQENFDRVLEELANDKTLAMMGDKLFSDDPALADREAVAGSIERNARRRRRDEQASAGKEAAPTPRRRRKRDEAPKGQPRDQRKRRRSVSATGTEAAQPVTADDATQATPAKRAEGGEQPKNKNRRRRRSRKPSGANVSRAENAREQSAAAPSPRGTAKPRPGQHSSTVSGDAAQGSGEPGSGQAKRKRRRRRSGAKKNTQGWSQNNSSSASSSSNKAGE